MYIQNKREKDKNVEAFDEGPQEEKEEKSFWENSEKCIKTLLVILSLSRFNTSNFQAYH